MNQTLNLKDLSRWIFFFLLFGMFIFINIPFFMPFLLAGIFALGLEDFINKFRAKTKLNRGFCIFLTLVSGFLIFLAPVSLAIYRGIVYFSQMKTVDPDKLMGQTKNLKDLLISNLQRVSEWTGLDLANPAQTTIEKVTQKIGEILLKASTDFFSQLPAILLGLLVFIIFLSIFLSKSQKIKEFVLRFTVLEKKFSESIIKISKESCSVTLFSTLVIGVIQAFIIGIGSLIFNEGDFWLVLAVTFFVAFIPVIGAAPVGFFLSLLAFIGGRTGSGIGMAVFATIAGTIDNFLKPLLVGKEHKLSPVIGFTSVLGAIIMIGLPGLLIGPVVMNLFAGTSALLFENKEKIYTVYP
ncbi:MAG: AI-2E family transporter [Bdellovibrio sp.]